MYNRKVYTVKFRLGIKRLEIAEYFRRRKMQRDRKQTLQQKALITCHASTDNPRQWKKARKEKILTSRRKTWNHFRRKIK